MNARRPLFVRQLIVRQFTVLQLLLLTLLLLGTMACDRTSLGPPATKEGSGSVEAERTREMEDKAAEIERQAEDLRTMEGSEQDKIDAYNKLQQSQQELNSMSESSEGGN